MSFVGDLEHLPIVDVIQLLHATRKSGTLCLKSSKGESQLVFKDGCIVSANHSNNSVRIGQILVQMQKISKETLDATLAEQKSTGSGRPPLIASLIESGKIKKEDAFKGLQTLIEMTIVEVLTWTEGTFELDVESTVVSDEYRYIPEKMKLDLNLNTQNVLMDALRIYDEKKRDGTLDEETFHGEAEMTVPSLGTSAEASDQVISIDDLGLDVLDDLEKVIPGFFTPVKVYDPAKIHRDKTSSCLSNIPLEQQEQLFNYLANISTATISHANEHTTAATHALILFSSSEFICHAVMTVCKQEGFFTFSTDEEENLYHIINQSRTKNLFPVILLDQSGNLSGEDLDGVTMRILDKHPEIPVFHLVPAIDFRPVLMSMRTGVRAVLPKPDQVGRRSSFVDDTIFFLETIKKTLKVTPQLAVPPIPDAFRTSIEEISSLKELAEITGAIDRYLSVVMARAVTFVLKRSDLVCETICRSSAVEPLAMTLPMTGESPLHQTLSTGSVFSGEADDTRLKDLVYSTIGTPASSRIVVVPFKCLGRTLAVTYGDFGSQTPREVSIDLLEALVKYAGVIYENALYRKKFEKMLQAQQ